jgi:D-threo-aldose 1-dehydrogenase
VAFRWENEFKLVTDELATPLSRPHGIGSLLLEMAPWYGLGVAERRNGRFLRNKKPNEYIPSTKVEQAS